MKQNNELNYNTCVNHILHYIDENIVNLFEGCIEAQPFTLNSYQIHSVDHVIPSDVNNVKTLTDLLFVGIKKNIILNILTTLLLYTDCSKENYVDLSFGRGAMFLIKDGNAKGLEIVLVKKISMCYLL